MFLNVFSTILPFLGVSHVACSQQHVVGVHMCSELVRVHQVVLIWYF